MNGTPPVVEIVRELVEDRGVLGVMLLDGVKMGVVLERPWLENKPRISCIPEGEYTAMIEFSPKFSPRLNGRHLPELQNVPNRSQILIHHGNWVRDSTGCILLGTSRGPDDESGGFFITKSKDALFEFLDKVEEKITAAALVKPEFLVRIRRA